MWNAPTMRSRWRFPSFVRPLSEGCDYMTSRNTYTENIKNYISNHRKRALNFIFGHNMCYSMSYSMDQTEEKNSIFFSISQKKRDFSWPPRLSTPEPTISGSYSAVSYTLTRFSCWFGSPVKNTTPVQIWASKLISSSFWSHFWFKMDMLQISALKGSQKSENWL